MKHYQEIILAVVLGFAAGFMGGHDYRADLEARRTVEVPDPDTAREHIAQYSCLHARATGNVAQLKGCL